MANIQDYAALHAKIKARRGRLLKSEDYIHLLNAESASEAVLYLAEHTRYRSLLTPELQLESNLIKLESVLQGSRFEELEHLFHFVSDAYRAFFNVLFMRFEVENLKLMIRMLNENKDVRSVMPDLKLRYNSKLPYDVLGTSRSFQDFVENLRGTPYYRVISGYTHENPKRVRFYMDMVLDRYYFDCLQKAAKKLPQHEREEVRGLIAINVDLLNLEWLYRGRRFYQMAPEELLNYALGGGKYFNFDNLKRLSYMATLEEMMEEIRHSRYGQLIGDEADFETHMGQRVHQSLYQAFMARSNAGVTSILGVLAYIHQVEYEIRDVFSILEMKRYGIFGDEGKLYLVKNL